jgi:hypothetical protein
MRSRWTLGTALVVILILSSQMLPDDAPAQAQAVPTCQHRVNKRYIATPDHPVSYASGESSSFPFDAREV